MIFANDPQSSKESKTNLDVHDQNELFDQYKDCFASTIPNELPPFGREDDHRIDLIPESSPPKRPPYRVSYVQQKEILAQVNELLEK